MGACEGIWAARVVGVGTGMLVLAHVVWINGTVPVSSIERAGSAPSAQLGVCMYRGGALEVLPSDLCGVIRY